MWTCSLTDYACTKGGAIPPIMLAGGRGGAPAAGEDDPQANPEPVGGDPVDGLEYQPPPPQQGAAGQGGPGRGPSGCAPRAAILRPGTRTGPWRPRRALPPRPHYPRSAPRSTASGKR